MAGRSDVLPGFPVNLFNLSIGRGVQMAGIVSFRSPILVRRVVYVVAFLVFVTAVPLGQSQTSKGTVAGTVTDPAGGGGARAGGVLKQKETGAQRETTTNEAGIYRFEAVNLGTYDLTTKAPGFREARVGDIIVTANQVASFDLHLELGSATESVTVEASAVTLQTSEAVRGGNFEAQQVVQLPRPPQDA